MRALLAGVLLLGAISATAEPKSILRFALIAGANRGGGDRVELKYAESDALGFARVLDELGGVPPENLMVLRQPELDELEQGLARLGQRIDAAKQTGKARRTELLVYYSGHADEAGLLLGNDRYSYATLRRRLEEIDADVRIAVLDACASGAITRIKGGTRRRPARGPAGCARSARTRRRRER
jgi:hypothetical protein